jgi:hypothetical protein
VRSFETSAVASVRNLAAAQAQFREARGRHGTIPELIEAALIATGFGPDESGRSYRSGYYFKTLPDGSAFAWPRARNERTRRSFFIDQEGRFYSCRRFGGTHEPLRVDQGWKLLDQ